MTYSCMLMLTHMSWQKMEEHSQSNKVCRSCFLGFIFTFLLLVSCTWAAQPRLLTHAKLQLCDKLSGLHNSLNVMTFPLFLWTSREFRETVCATAEPEDKMPSALCTIWLCLLPNSAISWHLWAVDGVWPHHRNYLSIMRRRDAAAHWSQQTQRKRSWRVTD